MSETESSDQSAANKQRRDHGSKDRIFLVVVDDSDEMLQAMRFACRRALHTGGRVALLYVIEPAEFNHWMAVGDLMQEEAREEAERRLQDMAEEVQEYSGQMPVLYVREGDRRDELLKLVNEDEQISILVLGASSGSGGPGPLLTALMGKHIGKLRVPITVVPDNLEPAAIDEIS
ncbi:universal stress protein [Kiloniella laminariae]|uniref:Universal stress protein n=1 Tax=Kiloniella laminariae TaxID=454162 RepID=A0ABT4LJM9_9PROT|nr:universal stress protein [Kiloniella laminariae]MCZ4281294.1 universal stress protein [Kiloniella laminariae]